MAAADKVVPAWTNQVRIDRGGYVPACLAPQALGRVQLAEAGLDNAGHDVVGVVGARPVPRVAGIGRPLPAVSAYALVEADTVASPLIRAATTDGSRLRGRGRALRGRSLVLGGGA